MQLTPNYNLKKPEGTDPVDIQDFNDNADLIDAALKKKAESSGGDISEMTVKTLDDITTEFPVPEAGESTKTFLGKVKKFFSDTKNWMTGVCLIDQIVNNCVTNNAKLPLSAAQGKVLMDLYTVLNTNDAYLKQKMDATNRAVNALRNDKLITIPVFTQSAAPYTADIKVQHLKTTDAIELYAGLIKSDSELTVAQKAEKIKMRRKYLNMIDDAECNTDGILTVTSYSKKPATEFAVWLRGCSAEEE